ncbi:MAG: hypothetical protein JZU60_02675 [Ilumatobacteraceae bacterium]|nr:hypothetical protein [Ilumatobacteraceae bacterium]
MAANKFQPAPTYALPVIEDAKTKTLVFNPLWLKWFLDLSQNLGVGGAGTGSVTSIATGVGLTGGPISTSGTISLKPIGTAGTYNSVTVNAYGQVTSGTADTGLTVGITTAKLTVGGVNGSMSFTNGRLTSQVQAT